MKKTLLAAVAAASVSGSVAMADDHPFECTINHWALGNTSDTPTFKQTFVAGDPDKRGYSFISEHVQVDGQPWQIWAMADGKLRVIEYIGPQNPSTGYYQNYESDVEGDAKGNELYVGPQGAGIFELVYIKCTDVGQSHIVPERILAKRFGK